MLRLKNTDFPFKEDSSFKLCTFIIAFMIYLISLSIVSCFYIGQLNSSWISAVSGKITIEFNPSSTHKSTQDVLNLEQIQKINKILNKISGISQTKIITKKEFQNAIFDIDNINFVNVKNVFKKRKNYDIDESDMQNAKILNQDGSEKQNTENKNIIINVNDIENFEINEKILQHFPYPTIFEIFIDDETCIDYTQLHDELLKIHPYVTIYNNSKAFLPFIKLNQTTYIFSFIISIIILLVVCVIIVFFTNSNLRRYEKIVKILQLIGANDSYIAKQFSTFYVISAFKACFIGMSFFGITMLALSEIAIFAIDIIEFVVCAKIMLLVCVLIVFIIFITSKVTAIKTLQREEFLN